LAQALQFFSKVLVFTKPITAVNPTKVPQVLIKKAQPNLSLLLKKTPLQLQHRRLIAKVMLLHPNHPSLHPRRIDMTQVKCPICDKPMNFQARSEWPDFPFCSLRCKRIDLGRWFGERYKLQGHDYPEDFHEENESE
jgi:endogenous inhibitor of DNA gyrase (YacG/DUF329 family)